VPRGGVVPCRARRVRRALARTGRAARTRAGASAGPRQDVAARARAPRAPAGRPAPAGPGCLAFTATAPGLGGPRSRLRHRSRPRPSLCGGRAQRRAPKALPTGAQGADPLGRRGRSMRPRRPSKPASKPPAAATDSTGVAPRHVAAAAMAQPPQASNHGARGPVLARPATAPPASAAPAGRLRARARASKALQGVERNPPPRAGRQRPPQAGSGLKRCEH